MKVSVFLLIPGRMFGFLSRAGAAGMEETWDEEIE